MDHRSNPLALASRLMGRLKKVAWLTVTMSLALLLPTMAKAQGLGAAGLSNFPFDTEQVAYVNVAEHRASHNYYAIHQQLFDRELDVFEMFTRRAGTDGEKDVDEILLSWRGG